MSHLCPQGQAVSTSVLDNHSPLVLLPGALAGRHDLMPPPSLGVNGGSFSPSARGRNSGERQGVATMPAFMGPFLCADCFLCTASSSRRARQCFSPTLLMKSLKPREVKDMLRASPDLSAGLCAGASGLVLLSKSEPPGKPWPLWPGRSVGCHPVHHNFWSDHVPRLQA